VSGETHDDPLGWTPDLLLVHFDTVRGEMDRRIEQRFTDLDKAVTAALAAVKEAGDKAEDERKAWQANSNEWRGAMDDREARFMPRTEHQSTYSSLSAQVTDNAQRTAASLASIGSRLDLMTGRAAGSNVEQRLAEIAKQIDANSSTIITEGAKAAGGREVIINRRQSQAAVYAAIGVGITILSFLMALGAYVVAKP